MNIYESAENYLEAILSLHERHGLVRSIDIANELHFSKPSVSVAMKKLRESGYIEMDKDGFISLLPSGEEIARRIYERHKLLTQFFIRLGVDPEVAAADACKVEHDLEILQDTPLLIFVQPTRGLDIGAIENIHKQILAERDKGKAILLISLELDEIMNLADTIGVIYNGQIQKIADASTLTTKEVGQFMMGVKNENDKDGREVKD